MRRSVVRAVVAARLVPMRSVFVQTASTPNPDSQKYFSADVLFLPPGNSAFFPTAQSALRSKLAQSLFAIEGVKSAFISSDYVTVSKSPGTTWDDIDGDVFAAITEYASSGQTSAIDASASVADDIAPHATDTDVVGAIKEVIAARVRPFIMRDGGSIRFLGFDEASGRVFVQLLGACVSCPSSTVTLKSGIERNLMYFVPEVTEVVSVGEEDADDVHAELSEIAANRAAATAAAKSASKPPPVGSDVQNS